jgi:hypothetical protein
MIRPGDARLMMPLNPTGKVDRAALKKMAAGDHAHYV